MNMSVLKYGDISPRTAAYAAAEMLKRAMPYLILQPFAQTRPIPANSSDTIKFRRYNSLPLALTPLAEGVTPSGNTMTATDVSATLSQYGDYIPISDKIADTHEDQVFKEAQAVIGEQAAQTVETILFNILKAGTNVFYTNGADRDEVNTVYDHDLQTKVVRAFKRQNARKLTKKQDSSVKFNTENVSGGFIGFVHPDLEPTIRAFSDFIDVKDYGSTTPHESEFGASGEVRYLTSTVFQPWADAGAAGATMIATTNSAVAVDVYPILIVAADSFAVTPLKGKNAIMPMVLNPGVPREGDPLGQRGYVGWKTWFTGCILNQVWMARVECAVLEL
jgi:N4-gp56 family major capsid protein